VHRLIGEGEPVDLEQLIAGLALGDRAPADRPYVIANFAVSVDGRSTLGGVSRGLGGEDDRRLFHVLRACADAVMAGTGTLRAERYGRMIRRGEGLALRERLGLAAQPIACTVTLSGSVPLDIPLFADPASRVVVYAGAPVNVAGAAADVEVVALPAGAPPMRAALADLRRRRGVRLLLCEGGPTVFDALLGEGVVDELFLTLAPVLAGGTGPGLTRGLALRAPASLDPEWVLQGDGSLFLRYRLRN
jgi:riboflavin biosynthesis pyrimidine reductase